MPVTTEKCELQCSAGGVSVCFGAAIGNRGTLRVCVPEQAKGSAMKDCYEVSTKLSRPTDRRSC
jgi:hypothetical protein